MLEEIRKILKNAKYFTDSDYKYEVQELVDILINYSLESNVNIHELREQLYLIKFEIE